jgi:site-specific DNA-methyltransferase (adenine-specific)
MVFIRDTIYNEDCLVGMQRIPDGSIDMILCDLPYGTSACKWDSVIPFEPLWEQYRRIAKKNAAIVLTASQPFTTALINSNIGQFKYSWVWEKTIAANFGRLKWGPMKRHEDIAVFCAGSPQYNPQMERGKPYTDKARPRKNRLLTAGLNVKAPIVNTGTRHPSSVIRVPNPNNRNVHPTQKPVALFEYLIRTYTKEGKTVLDSCIGSGTTAIAAINTNRHYIGFEKDPHYFELAQKRIQNHEKRSTCGQITSPSRWHGAPVPRSLFETA